VLYKFHDGNARDGLAVKARVARFSCEHYWDEPEEDLDWDELMARKLIDAVLDFWRSD
jgi:hypothetical protein